MQYVTHQPLTAEQVLEKAAEILAHQYLRGDAYSNPQATKDFLKFKYGAQEREVFALMLLDNQHRLIELCELFYGTINAASVYPREVVKKALEANSAAVILVHNHPSGNAEPSESDKQITVKLTDALDLIGVKVLDHIVVGEVPVSFAERGLLR